MSLSLANNCIMCHIRWELRLATVGTVLATYVYNKRKE
jgi:hypothetical protein